MTKLRSVARLKSSSEKEPSTVGSETSSEGQPPTYISLDIPSQGCMLNASRLDVILVGEREREREHERDLLVVVGLVFLELPLLGLEDMYLSNESRSRRCLGGLDASCMLWYDV